ncbi:hypothetical protein [Actinoplanes auranticolor]|uniref:Uncharacterized protein n=1 Tax=Actinoplanes auranticolor TaxID=47988 RepID=A0A919VSY2_9ACTN|nr:hypothetical protein [Actinoplanes auranticolor]GIM75341.1 hypothetical protein Aau02nite_65460 [Actinoplanes auranticolor]
MTAAVEREDLAGCVQNIGWQNWQCTRRSGQVQIGIVGRSLSLEALRVQV